MTGSIDNAFKTERLLEEVKIAIARAYRSLFKSEYHSLLRIAYGLTNDKEIAKEILEESFSAVLESGFKSFQLDLNQVKAQLLVQIKDSCQKHINEVNASKEFQILQAEFDNFDNSNEEEIIKAAQEAFNELPEFRKKILYETLHSNSSARQVAENNNIERDKVLKLNFYSIQLIKKKLLQQFSLIK